MGFSELVLLGAIAGFTIYLGLPAGRLGGVDERVRVALPMFSVGILAFIFMDVTKHGQEIVDATLGGFKDHRTSLLHVVGLFSLLAAGFTAGTAGIATIQRSLRGRRPSNPPIAGGSTATAFTARELAAHADDTRRAALQTGMTIAAAIGLHNFAEGLAIGVSGYGLRLDLHNCGLDYTSHQYRVFGDRSHPSLVLAVEGRGSCNWSWLVGRAAKLISGRREMR